MFRPLQLFCLLVLGSTMSNAHAEVVREELPSGLSAEADYRPG